MLYILYYIIVLIFTLKNVHIDQCIRIFFNFEVDLNSIGLRLNT